MVTETTPKQCHAGRGWRWGPNWNFFRNGLSGFGINWLDNGQDGEGLNGRKLHADDNWRNHHRHHLSLGWCNAAIVSAKARNLLDGCLRSGWASSGAMVLVGAPW